MWLFLGYANVPIDELSYNATSLLPATALADCYSSYCATAITPTSLKVSVTIPVYIIALVAFVGWFLFTLFAGVGLVASTHTTLAPVET